MFVIVSLTIELDTGRAAMKEAFTEAIRVAEAHQNSNPKCGYTQCPHAGNEASCVVAD